MMDYNSMFKKNAQSWVVEKARRYIIILRLRNIGQDLENIVGHTIQDAALRFFGIFGI